MGRSAPRSGARLAKRKTGATRSASPVAIPAADSSAQSPAPAALSDTTTEKILPAHVPLPPPLPDAPWMAADAAVVGTAHLRTSPPKPCQDAALADSGKRALAILADGAGSAAVSHIGATAVVAGVRRLCRTLEGDLATALDLEVVTPGLAETVARRIVAHAKGLLDDLAELHLRGPEDFRCTLLLWLSGRQRALWLKVGDGALIAEADGQCRCIGPAGKGEFANQTCFIGPRLEKSQWAWGEIDAVRLSGLAAMSDGAAERLVAGDASRVSPAMGKLLRGVAQVKVGRREVFGLLAEADFWKGTSGDDKSLAMIARSVAIDKEARDSQACLNPADTVRCND
jgi:hypothetical protein